jgi:hypothetical protein
MDESDRIDDSEVTYAEQIIEDQNSLDVVIMLAANAIIN